MLKNPWCGVEVGLRYPCFPEIPLVLAHVLPLGIALVCQDRCFRSCRTEIWAKFPFSHTKDLMALDWSHLAAFESRMDHVSTWLVISATKKGNFYLPTRTNVQMYISGFVASSACAQSPRKNCANCAENSPPHPSFCTFVSHQPWEAFLLGFASQIIGLVQLRAWPKDRLWSPHLHLPSHCCPSLSTAALRRCLCLWSSCNLLQEPAKGLIQIAPHQLL